MHGLTHHALARTKENKLPHGQHQRTLSLLLTLYTDSHTPVYKLLAKEQRICDLSHNHSTFKAGRKHTQKYFF